MAHRKAPRRPASASAPAARGARWLPWTVIAAVGIGVYLNGIRIPFFWDDLPSIVNNATIRSLWPLPAAFAPPLETPMAGRPVVNASLALNFALGGLNVEGYHWWNIGVHVSCAMLLYAIVRAVRAGQP